MAVGRCWRGWSPDPLLPEIVVDGETGLLVPSGDKPALAEAVVALVRDPVRRTAMGQAGRRRAQTHFTAQRMAAQVMAIYEQVFAEQAPNGNSRPPAGDWIHEPSTG